ncbi:WYL domain-containing protein [Flavobacterium procerum]|uniref:WYL domain-containing protein n=1 Tax=Flavobacterium procerum TaxID=1455569 RepID=UPI0035E6BCC2
MQNLYVAKFTHQKHWEDFSTKREVYPIAIKESHQRWYLIALDKKDEKVKTFGLDRISNLIVTDTKFKPIRYNVEKERISACLRCRNLFSCRKSSTRIC